MTTWTHKVVKSQIGNNGCWFNYPATATFNDEATARQFAETFAAEQRAAGVTGTRIVVRSRKTFSGDFGPTNCVAEYRV